MLNSIFESVNFNTLGRAKQAKHQSLSLGTRKRHREKGASGVTRSSLVWLRRYPRRDSITPQRGLWPQQLEASETMRQHEGDGSRIAHPRPCGYRDGQGNGDSAQH